MPLARLYLVGVTGDSPFTLGVESQTVLVYDPVEDASNLVRCDVKAGTFCIEGSATVYLAKDWAKEWTWFSLPRKRK